MTSSDDAAKIEKKRAKAKLKEEKKRTKSGAPNPDATQMSSPAERSAAAAERQVRLQSYRVWFAALGVIVALTMLLLTFKPWKSQTQSPPTQQPPAARSENPAED